MKFFRPAFVLTALCAAMLLANPGVKTVKTSTTQFHGFLSTMMKMTGGDKVRTTTSYLEGSRMRADHVDAEGKPTTSNITDLDREVVINLDHKKKEYSEMTFAEFKEMMAKMKEKMAGMQPQSQQGAEVQMEFDYKVTPTGEKRTIAGFNAEKVIVTLEAKGQSQTTPTAPGGQGGMIITSTQWLTKDAPGKTEAMAFSKKFAEKMGLAMGAEGAMNQWQALAAFNPQLAKAMEKLAEEGKKLEGMAVRTESVFESWSDQVAQAPVAEGGKSQEIPSSVNDLLGGFGKKMAPKPKAGSAPGRTVLFESTEEIKEIKTGSFGAETFGTPAGYKKVESKMKSL